MILEGSDDESYLKLLSDKVKEIHPTVGCLSEVAFFPLRGKDNIIQKIEHNKRTLSSLIKDKIWNVIFDKDFSTLEVDNYLKEGIRRKNCKPYSHEGYCIESVVFSDIIILKKYVYSLVSSVIHQSSLVEDAVDIVLQNLADSIYDTNDDLNKEVEVRFKSQKNNRDEFKDLSFVDVMRSWTDANGDFKPESIMSKSLIRDFVIKLESEIGASLFLRTSNEAEEISSVLLSKYINFIEDINDLYPSFKQLLIQLGVIARSDSH